MSKAFIVLANNLKHFSVLVDTFYHKTLLEGVDFFVVYEQALGDISEELREICKGNVNFDKATILSSEPIVEWYLNKYDLSNEAQEFVNAYLMRMNLLVQPFFLVGIGYDRIGFFDEDLIIRESMIPYFESNDNLVAVDPMCNYATKDKEWVFEEMCRIFDLDPRKIDARKLYEFSINSGQRFYSKGPSFKIFETALVNLFESTKIQESMKHGLKSYGYKLVNWFMDQRFESYFAYKTAVSGSEPTAILDKKFSAVLYGLRKRWVEEPTRKVMPPFKIVHYCGGSRKEELLDRLLLDIENHGL